MQWRGEAFGLGVARLNGDSSLRHPIIENLYLRIGEMDRGHQLLKGKVVFREKKLMKDFFLSGGLTNGKSYYSDSQSKRTL